MIIEVENEPALPDEVPKVIPAWNVNDAFLLGIETIQRNGEEVETRNGTAKVLAAPLITHYARPDQRMLLHPLRDANPFFHVFEALWMLAGRNDVEFVSHYAANMSNFSNDGKTLNGAYGYRWRHAFGVDQLEKIIEILGKDPASRRVVLQMWDTEKDLLAGDSGSKDVCCNMLVKYRIVKGRLFAYVLNRSNDMVFGGYGANAVHFSFLQQYLADRLNVGLGGYDQVSLDAHMYTEKLYGEKLYRNLGSLTGATSTSPEYFEPYFIFNLFTLSPLWMRVGYPEARSVGMTPAPFLEGRDPTELASQFEADLQRVTQLGDLPSQEDLKHFYFRYVIQPMMEAHRWHKAGRTRFAVDLMKKMNEDVKNLALVADEYDYDVAIACIQWLERRLK